ncbi:MAG: DUF4292 domain-containing protein [Myxococcota bacterium]
MRLCLFALMMGCACRPNAPRVDLAGLPEPEALVETLRTQSEARRNLRAQGRVTAFGPEGRVRLKTVLLAERPGSFRVETLTPFEQPVDVMACDGARIWLLREGRLFAGPATPANVARLLPLPLRPDEIVETLLGGVPVPDGFTPTRIGVEDDRWRLELEGPRGEQGVLRIRPEGPRVDRAQWLDVDGTLQVQVEFDDFEKAEDGGPPYPKSIRVEVPPSDTKVEIRLRDAETDVSLAGALFFIEPPPGQVPEPLGAQPAAPATP